MMASANRPLILALGRSRRPSTPLSVPFLNMVSLAPLDGSESGLASLPSGRCPRVSGRDGESAWLGRSGRSAIWVAAPGAADAHAPAASGASVRRDTGVAEALCLAVGVRGALPGLRTEDILSADAP